MDTQALHDQISKLLVDVEATIDNVEARGFNQYTKVYAELRLAWLAVRSAIDELEVN